MSAIIIAVAPWAIAIAVGLQVSTVVTEQALTKVSTYIVYIYMPVAPGDQGYDIVVVSYHTLSYPLFHSRI